MQIRLDWLNQKGGYNFLPPYYIPARSSRSLIWNGSSLEVVSCQESPRFHLHVSQSTVQNNKRLTLEGVEAIRALEALAALLAEKAFFCPIPLTLDDKRLDGIQRGIPVDSCHSIAVLCGSGDFPRLALPPGAEAGLPEGRDFGCCAAIFGHLSSLDEMTSRLFWIRDGVVIDQEVLPFNGRVSTHVFVSAEGLETDLTGFSVRGGEERVARVFASLASSVAGLKVNYNEPEGSSFGWVNHLGKAVMAGSVLFLGVGTMFGSPLTLLMGGAVGVAGYRLRQFQPPTLEPVSDCLERGLQQLKVAWPNQLGRLDQQKEAASRSRRRRQAGRPEQV